MKCSGINFPRMTPDGRSQITVGVASLSLASRKIAQFCANEPLKNDARENLRARLSGSVSIQACSDPSPQSSQSFFFVAASTVRILVVIHIRTILRIQAWVGIVTTRRRETQTMQPHSYRHAPRQKNSAVDPVLSLGPLLASNRICSAS